MEGHTITLEELSRRFNHHPPPDQPTGEKHSEIRRVLLDAADRCVQLSGASSPEQSLAVRKLEEGMMWFNADIARKGADAAAAHSL
jgi:hypothetical protein